MRRSEPARLTLPGDSSRDDLRTLHEYLAATGELPVETPASHYLGEAEAVVADALKLGTSESVVRQRVQQARELLSEVEATGSDVVDEHVAAARERCRAILEAYGRRLGASLPRYSGGTPSSMRRM